MFGISWTKCINCCFCIPNRPPEGLNIGHPDIKSPVSSGKNSKQNGHKISHRRSNTISTDILTLKKTDDNQQKARTTYERIGNILSNNDTNLNTLVNSDFLLPYLKEDDSSNNIPIQPQIPPVKDKWKYYHQRSYSAGI